MSDETNRLTENDVVDAVCDRLESAGWTVTQRLTTTQKGDDIVAQLGTVRLAVEAKGATSARTGSPRLVLRSTALRRVFTSQRPCSRPFRSSQGTSPPSHFVRALPSPRMRCTGPSFNR